MKVVCVLLFALVFTLATPSTALDCSEFNPQNIKLVTFDVFAALSLLVDSLTANIAQILPQLSPTQVDTVVNSWLLAYENHEGLCYLQSEVGNSPFRWMLTTTLPSILASVGLNSVDNGTQEALIATWGNLTPRETAKYTLIKVSSAGYQVGPLSNGDTQTIGNAFSVYAPEVTPSFLFSSDWPVMCMKNQSRIYQNVLNVTGYSPLQVLHVAGAMYDGQGARSAGLFSAVLMGDTKRSIHSSNGAPLPQPCFLLNSLSDLVPILIP